MGKTLSFLKHELMELLWPTLFFLCVFTVVAAMRALIAQQYGIPPKSFVAVVIGALVVGKAILITDAIPFAKWFREPRLIGNVLWRCFLYALLILLFQFLEEWIPMISKYGSGSAAFEHLVEEIQWHRFWATHIILVVFLSTYVVGTTVIGVMGRHEFLALFFGSRSGHDT